MRISTGQFSVSTFEGVSQAPCSIFKHDYGVTWCVTPAPHRFAFVHLLWLAKQLNCSDVRNIYTLCYKAIHIVFTKLHK